MLKKEMMETFALKMLKSAWKQLRLLGVHKGKGIRKFLLKEFLYLAQKLSYGLFNIVIYFHNII